jgi:hypothetical protein
MRGARFGEGARLGAGEHQVGDEHLRHGHAGGLGERRLDGGQRVADVAAELLERELVGFGGAAVGAGERVAVKVLEGHGIPEWRWNEPP